MFVVNLVFGMGKGQMERWIDFEEFKICWQRWTQPHLVSSTTVLSQLLVLKYHFLTIFAAISSVGVLNEKGASAPRSVNNKFHSNNTIIANKDD